MKPYIVLLIALFAILTLSKAAIANDSSLFDQFKAKDEEFFEQSFNQCNIDYLRKHVSDSLTFFHDQSGIQNKQQLIEGTQKYICANPAKKPIRKRIPGTLSVYPLYDNGVLYGVIQAGEHNFYIREKGKSDRLTSSAKFTSVWLLENKRWKLTQVHSYDHQSPISETTINQWLETHNVPALGLATITNGNITSTEVFGHLSKGIKAPQQTMFKVASLTKPVVTLIALKLAQQGLLDLDEPLFPYWIDPEVSDNPNHKLLTTRIVLTHKTGFKNWRWMEDNKTLQFNFPPGDKHQYSGEGFEYLRRALENKFNTSIEKLANEYVFAPANMNNSHFWWNQQASKAPFAINHDKDGNPLPTQKYFEANAAANLLTTIEDYAQFLTYVMEQEQHMPMLYADMLRPQVKLGDKHFFGLGWEIFTDFPGGETLALHSGKDPGVNTLAVFFPKTKNGYVIFTNGDNALPVFKALLNELYLGQQLWQRR